MKTYAQVERSMAVFTPLGPDALLLTAFRGREAISELFRFELEVAAELDAPVPFEALLGKPIGVSLRLPGGRERRFDGFCSQVAQIGHDETFMYYRLVMVPDVWFLTRKAQSRIFQQVPTPEVLQRVLAGLSVALRFRGRYHPRDYCVQYRETDFDFASRLMEEEGAFYYFRHTGKGSEMIVSDDPGGFPALERKRPVEFERTFGGENHEDRVFTWEKAQELRSGKVSLRDHCFEVPDNPLGAESQIQERVRVGTVDHVLRIGLNGRLELYDYPGRYAQRFDGIDPAGGDRSGDLARIFEDKDRTAALLMEQEACAALIIRGTSACRDLEAGRRFTLVGHHDADGEYLLTSVEHEVRLAGDYRSEQDHTLSYHNRFTCVPVGLPFRPTRVTAKPVIHGTQSARVTGPSGEEIFTDRYGRVKVQFPWDRQGKGDASSSCWVRVAQPTAGGGLNAIFLPRVGQEVIVAFEEGDPDRPIIVGSVYNAAQMPPYGLPAQKMVSGLKTNTYPGGGGYNELCFDDSKGKELVRVHAQYDMDSTVRHDLREHVRNDRFRDVTGKETVTIGKNRSATISGSETYTINGFRALTIHKASAETVKYGKMLTIGGAYVVNVGMANVVTIGGFKVEHIEAYCYQGVKGRKKENVEGKKQVFIGSDLTEQIKGKMVTTVVDTKQVNAKEITLVAEERIVLKCGESSIAMDKNGWIQIKGKTIETHGEEVTVTGTSRLDMEGGTFTLESTSGDGEVRAQSTLEVKGTMVKINC